MKIELNAAAYEVPDGVTLERLIHRAAGSTRGSAASVDGQIVPRSEWPHFVVCAGQSVEIITAVQGG